MACEKQTVNCKDCKNYKFESGDPEVCPSSYGVMYCELIHGKTRAFSSEEVDKIRINGFPENCPINIVDNINIEE